MHYACSFFVFQCFVNYEQQIEIDQCHEQCQNHQGSIISWSNYRDYEPLLIEALQPVPNGQHIPTTLTFDHSLREVVDDSEIIRSLKWKVNHPRIEKINVIRQRNGTTADLLGPYRSLWTEMTVYKDSCVKFINGICQAETGHFMCGDSNATWFSMFSLKFFFQCQKTI